MSCKALFSGRNSMPSDIPATTTPVSGTACFWITPPELRGWQATLLLGLTPQTPLPWPACHFLSTTKDTTPPSFQNSTHHWRMAKEGAFTFPVAYHLPCSSSLILFRTYPCVYALHTRSYNALLTPMGQDLQPRRSRFPLPPAPTS